MIEANQLRIGNWVMDRGNKQWQIDCWESPKKVASIAPYLYELYGNYIYGHPLTEDVEYLQPIPLTHEILEKCGFVDTEYEWTKGSIIVKWSSRIVSSGLRQGLYVEGLDHIQHLHQLQNLYYCICGEELIYKP